MKPGVIRRRTPLDRGTTPLARRAVLEPRVVPRSRFPKRRCPAYVAWIRTQPCVLTGRRQVEACHVISRGAGGVDVGNLVPLAPALHREQHDIGILSFQAKYGIDLTRAAQQLAVLYHHQQEQPR